MCTLREMVILSNPTPYLSPPPNKKKCSKSDKISAFVIYNQKSSCILWIKDTTLLIFFPLLSWVASTWLAFRTTERERGNKVESWEENIISEIKKAKPQIGEQVLHLCA